MLTEEGIGRYRKRHRDGCLSGFSPDPLIRTRCGHLLPMGEGGRVLLLPLFAINADLLLRGAVGEGEEDGVLGGADA